MASTIERLRESLDPQTVSNAIYGLMLEWVHAYLELVTLLAPDGRLRAEVRGKQSTRRLTLKVRLYEQVLASLFGVEPETIREFLLEHYEIKEIPKWHAS